MNELFSFGTFFCVLRLHVVFIIILLVFSALLCLLFPSSLA